MERVPGSLEPTVKIWPAEKRYSALRLGLGGCNLLTKANGLEQPLGGRGGLGVLLEAEEKDRVAAGKC